MSELVQNTRNSDQSTAKDTLLSSHFPQSSASNGLGNSLADVISYLKNKPATDRAVVSQGFGVTPGELPLRFLSYAIPTLRLCEEASGIDSIEFYIARNGVSRANPEYDLQSLKENSDLIREKLQRYISLRYPSLIGKVRILEDGIITQDSKTQEFIDQTVDLFKEIYTEDEAVARFIEAKGGDNAMRYVVEHSLYMRDPLQPSPLEHLLVPGMNPEPDAVVMIGGGSEKVFYRARQLLLNALETKKEWSAYQLFCSVGDGRPTYHTEPGEPLWSECKSFSDPTEILNKINEGVTSQYGRRKSIARDSLTLLLDAAEMSLVPKPAHIKAFLAGKITTPERNALERGLERLKSL